MRMHKELYELLRQEMLQMFSVTNAMLKVTMYENVQSQEFENLNASEMEDLEELSANIYMMARIQKKKTTTLRMGQAMILHSLVSSNVCANVCDTEEIIENATKSQLKMKEKLQDLIAIEKKANFLPIDNGKLNDLYEIFVAQVELSLEHKYFSETSISNATPTNAIIQKEFPEYVQVMKSVFDSMESNLDETLKQNEILNDRLFEATLNHDVEKCVLMYSKSKNDDLNIQIERLKRESTDI
ncbi:hypothetical protein Tco_0676942 [Tanacetum coccineum]